MHGDQITHWVALHRADPVAFDAARETVIALELARARPQDTGPARQLLARLRCDTDAVNDEQRLRRAALYMTAALAQMTRAIERLEQAAALRVANLPPGAAPSGPDGPTTMPPRAGPPA